MEINKHNNLSIISENPPLATDVVQLIRYSVVTAYHLPTSQIDELYTGIHKHEKKKYFERLTHKQILSL